MGNSSCNLCLRPQLSPEIQHQLSLYEGVALTYNQYYGECQVLKSKQDNKSYVMLKQTVDTSNHLSRLAVLQQLQKCSDGPANKNIVSTNLIADIQKSGFMSKSRELYVVHDFIVTDLRKEFEVREKSGREFNQDEIKTIIKECTKGFLRLELADYASVSIEHIYLCGAGNEIKVAHPKLFNYESNYRIALKDYNMANILNIYLSPEQLAAVEKSDYSYKSGWVSQAYSFGMILLSLMKMKNLEYVYNYRDCSISYDQIELLIRQCNGKFTFHLISIVQELLREKEGQRLTFKGLLNRIQTNTLINKFMDLQFVRASGNYEQQPQEKMSQQQEYKLNLRQPIPKYPNYISAFLKPKISISGEYVFLDNQEPNFNRYTTDTVIANQRLRYSDNTTARGSMGTYIGQVLNLQRMKENEPLREGKGIYQHSDGQTYIGEWHKGKMQGYGKLYCNSKKLRYEGQFKNGLFHGKGVEYSQNQIPQREEEIQAEYVKIFKGNWVRYDGYYVEDKRSGAGKIYFRKGYWKGNFKNGQPNGEGVYNSYATNQETKGMWRDGEMSK